MVKWIVGEAPEEGTLVCRFPPDNGVHSLDRLAQPIEIRNRQVKQEVELEVGADIRKGIPKKGQQQEKTTRRVLESETLEICDKDGRVRFTGSAQESSNPWFVVKEVISKNGEKVYHVTRADEWVNFSARTTATESAADLEESERIMKEARVKAKLEFNEYLKQKRKKAEENGLAVPASEEEPEDGLKSKAKKKLIFRRARGLVDGDDMELAESSVAYLGKSGGEIEGEWEGEEAFSDDDDQLFEEDVREELNIDVEDEDIEKDHEAPDDEDLDAQAEELFKNAFGSEIKQIIEEENDKEHVADEDLDDELSKYAADVSPEEEEGEGGQETSKITPVPTAPPVTRKPASKEEQIRARVKGMFWRNDNKLKAKEVLSQFPGINKASEEYQFLTKALRDLAELQGDVLILKQQFRK